MFLLYSDSSDIQFDIISIDLDGDVLQQLTDTGAGDAFARIDHEQGIMGGALDEFFIEIEKLVLLPFEIGAGMWTLIVIGKKLAILVYYEDRLGFTFDLDLETLTAGVFDITGFAENVGHNVW